MKCYNCGMVAKNLERLLSQIKQGCPHFTELIKGKYLSEKSGFEKEYKCDTEYESSLPF